MPLTCNSKTLFGTLLLRLCDLYDTTKYTKSSNNYFKASFLSRSHLDCQIYIEFDSFGSSTIPGHQMLEKTYLFFPNNTVFRYFNYLVMFA